MSNKSTKNSIPEKFLDLGDKYHTTLKDEVRKVLWQINLDKYSTKIFSYSLSHAKINYTLGIYSNQIFSAKEYTAMITEQMIAKEIEAECLEKLGWQIDYNSQFHLSDILLDPVIILQ